ncbi:MAG TPA: tetratricopeptide repeat protein [Candidatus Merdenecus merdavium]|nr:tetratricopeptide repeat protein [Candidatus Merdenecus merdavium]
MKKKVFIVLGLTLTLALSGCNKKDTNNYIGKGTEALEKSDYEEALAQFDDALADEVELLQAYRGLGIAYLGKEDYPNAIVNFGKALAEKGASHENVKKDLLYYKGTAQYKNEEYSKAIETFQELLEIEESKDAYYLRGLSQLAEGSVAEAEEDFRKAISLDPENIHLYIEIYQAYVALGLEEGGTIYLQDALNISANGSFNDYNIGQIYYYLKDYESARNSFNQAIENGDQEAMLFLGKVLYELNDIDNGITIYQKYLAEVKEDARAYNGLALGKIKKQDYDGALLNIQTGLSMDDGEVKQNLLFNEIVAYEGKADFATAKEKAAEFVALYPDDSVGQREYEFLQTR